MPPVFVVERWEPLEGIEAVDATGQVFRFEDSAELGPSHDPKTTEYPTLHDRALDAQDALEDLVQGEESLQVLAPHVFWKILELEFNAVRTVGKDALDVPAHLLLGRCTKGFHGTKRPRDAGRPRRRELGCLES